ncbi:hypothetical protein CFP65_1491 [Kitasatospora sp. MMS16-BH015]|uniref:septum formation family protein n=1 Tax=Kitasatospora sp. MMS16-BH015 TaxID=2018025 RepID=UPI000CA13F11|nr:septum formation family protein [Kitasatospora sp. MMS16-BH015]AUG76386.1 hypothetical protein CFP65_1491 [Kitasatospora sp. MMS16-BH015]
MRSGAAAAVGAGLVAAALTGCTQHTAGPARPSPTATASPSASATPARVLAAGLVAGDCFTTRGKGYLDVQRVDCAQPHDGEVFGRARFETTEFPSADLPPEQELHSTAAVECADAFGQFAVDSWALPDTVRLVYAYPDRPGWHEWSSRQAACVLTDTNGPRTGSLREDPSRFTQDQLTFLETENGLDGVLRQTAQDKDLAQNPTWGRLLRQAAASTATSLEEWPWPAAAAPAVKALSARLREAEGHLTAAANMRSPEARKQETDAALDQLTHAPVGPVRAALGLTTEPRSTDVPAALGDT